VQRETTPTHPQAAAAERAIQRIGTDEHHAWVCLADAGSVAHEGEPGGPLAGMAIGVKDIIDLRGLPTRCGSPSTTNSRPAAESASFVRALVGLGAVAVGKTHTTEYAYFAPAPTDNPRAPGHTPGGSSSGSAAAVSLGHVPVAVGSQTAGSVIRPASYCGVVGFVWSHGMFPMDGFAGLAESLDSVGLLGADVEGVDRVDRALRPGVGRSSVVRRAYLWTGEELDRVEPAMSDAVLALAGELDALGIRCIPLGLRHQMVELASDHLKVMAYEVARSRDDLLLAQDRLSEPLQRLLERGLATPDREYRAAVRRAAQAKARFTDLLADDAVIVGPAAPGAAPFGHGKTGSPIMSRPWQLLGMPQLSLPSGADDLGRPIGTQIVAAPQRDGLVLELGARLERRRHSSEQ
jgi:Asp-tRNA(Asn)/Glu-tRNA(Gln) amidotransferase A subunit family amidase